MPELQIEDWVAVASAGISVIALLLNIMITFLWRGQISVGGHIGGAISGAVCALVIMAPRHRRMNRSATATARSCRDQ